MQNIPSRRVVVVREYLFEYNTIRTRAYVHVTEQTIFYNFSKF